MTCENVAEEILSSVKTHISAFSSLRDGDAAIVRYEDLETWDNRLDIVSSVLDYNKPLMIWEFVVLLPIGHDNTSISDGEALVGQVAKECKNADFVIDSGITSGTNAHGCNPLYAYVAIRGIRSREQKRIGAALRIAREYAKDIDAVRTRLGHSALTFPPELRTTELSSSLEWDFQGNEIGSYDAVVLLSTGKANPSNDIDYLIQKNLFAPSEPDRVELRTGACQNRLLGAYYLFWAFKNKPLGANDKLESEFENDFHRCLVSDIPLYDAFQSMARKRIPSDSTERYQRLKMSGYVMQDEADIDVYTQHVAQRHIPKFKWLYANLFKKYRSVFSAPIDLVVWGCGCGLDLIALYDQAMKEGNPTFWLVVRSITLVDISAAAIKRAESIARLLFPTAGVKTFQADLKDQNQVLKIRLDAGFPYVTRVHLLSNILDLYDDVSPFAASLVRISARQIQIPPATGSGAFFNDVFVAFSPDYKGGGVRRNMTDFRKAWGNRGDDVALEGDAPLNCEYAVFECNSLKKSLAYQKYSIGNVFLRRIVKDAQQEQSEGAIVALIRELANVRVGEESFFDAYSFSEKFDYSLFEECEKNGEKKRCKVSHGAVFCLSTPARNNRPCIILKGGAVSERCQREAVCEFLRKFSGYIVDPRLKQLVSEMKSERERIWQETAKNAEAEVSGEEIDRLIDHATKNLSQELGSYLAVIWFDERKGRVFEGDCDSKRRIVIPSGDSKLDLTSYYVVVPGDIETLPPLSPEQRVIADSRQQLRKIKGGPGVGKTVTMLWHALRAVQRTHLPVLILCKTVSLINYNQRRLVATYLAENPGQQFLDGKLFRFMTIDAFLCSYVKRSRQCILRKCNDCQRDCKRRKVLNFPDRYLKSKEDYDRHNDILSRFNCSKCCRGTETKEMCRILGCKGLDKEGIKDSREISEKTLAEECRKCKVEIVRNLKSRKRGRRWEDEIGTVLVDEAQILDPEYVQSVYNLTESANKWREFYLFCDAQQAFRHNSLEQDGTTKKWDVKVPRTGETGKYFGSFYVLKENFRVKSRSLIEVCRIVQRKLRGKDEELTLYDWTKTAGSGDAGTGAFGIRAIQSVDFAFIEAEVNYLHDSCGAESVTVICDEQGMARRLAKPAREKKWITTHLPRESYVIEKGLRQRFYEHPGCNHLTSVDCAQGQSFEAVIFILSSNHEQFADGLMEQVFTALSRSGRFLRVLDASPSHWLYSLLKGGK